MNSNEDANGRRQIKMEEVQDDIINATSQDTGSRKNGVWLNG